MSQRMGPLPRPPLPTIVTLVSDLPLLLCSEALVYQVDLMQSSLNLPFKPLRLHSGELQRSGPTIQIIRPWH